MNHAVGICDGALLDGNSPTGRELPCCMATLNWAVSAPGIDVDFQGFAHLISMVPQKEQHAGVKKMEERAAMKHAALMNADLKTHTRHSMGAKAMENTTMQHPTLLVDQTVYVSEHAGGNKARAFVVRVCGEHLDLRWEQPGYPVFRKHIGEISVLESTRPRKKTKCSA